MEGLETDGFEHLVPREGAAAGPLPPGCLLPAQPQQCVPGCGHPTVCAGVQSPRHSVCSPPTVCAGALSLLSTRACRRPRGVKDSVCVRVCVRACVWGSRPPSGPCRVPLPGSVAGGPQPQDSLRAGEGARPSFPRTQSRRRSRTAPGTRDRRGEPAGGFLVPGGGALTAAAGGRGPAADPGRPRALELLRQDPGEATSARVLGTSQ